MKMAEILRNLADMIERNESGGEAPAEVPKQIQSPEFHKVEVPNDDAGEPTSMVAPLQQKLELLKKAAGVDSIYDEEGCETDPLDQMKKMAGIQVVAQAGEDAGE
jgi:hypothetical protein